MIQFTPALPVTPTAMEIWVNDNKEGSSPVSGNSIDWAPYFWVHNRTYPLYIRLVDNKRLAYRSSPIQFIVTDTDAFIDPPFTGLEQNIEYQSGEAIRLDWNDIQHAEIYIYEISTTENFEEGFVASEMMFYPPSEYVFDTIELEPGIYYWRIFAATAANFIIDWSNPRRFEVLPATP